MRSQSINQFNLIFLKSHNVTNYQILSTRKAAGEVMRSVYWPPEQIRGYEYCSKGEEKREKQTNKQTVTYAMLEQLQTADTIYTDRQNAFRKSSCIAM